MIRLLADCMAFDLLALRLGDALPRRSTAECPMANYVEGDVIHAH